MSPYSFRDKMTIYLYGEVQSYKEKNNYKKQSRHFLMQAIITREIICAVWMRNAILGNDLKVAMIIEHERKRCIHSMQRFIYFFDTDDDLARVPKMLAPQSRLADLGNTVIPEQLKGQ